MHLFRNADTYRHRLIKGPKLSVCKIPMKMYVFGCLQDSLRCQICTRTNVSQKNKENGYWIKMGFQITDGKVFCASRETNTPLIRKHPTWCIPWWKRNLYHSKFIRMPKIKNLISLPLTGRAAYTPTCRQPSPVPHSGLMEGNSRPLEQQLVNL
jgi:hypothetical protein